ncbi:MAG: glycosyltransferase [Rikenellaceae bacterium]
MKIVHYIPSIDRTSGGVGFYMQLLSKELGKLVELHVVTTKSCSELKLENCKVHYIPRGIFASAKSTWCDILRTIQPDVVHINGCWTPQCAFTQKWAQELGYRVVLTPHGMLEPWIVKRNYWTKKLPALMLYQRRAVQRASVLHATAESEKANLLKLGYNTNIAIVPNGVEVSNIKIKDSWSKSKKILFLSRVHPKKGIEFLIGAVAQLRTQLDGYEFIVAGEGDTSYVEQLKQKVAAFGVDHIFNFCGGVYGDKKWELFRQADIFVLPTYSENFGIVVAEALASGTPVLTTTGTPWSELNTYKCGWCVDPTQDSITAALDAAISTSDEELHAMGQRGRDRMLQNYSTDSVAERMTKMYKKVM